MSEIQALTPTGTQHLIDKVKTDKEDKFRFSTMPTASATWLGKTVEYTGTTTSTYTHSKRYECQTVPESSPVAYQWVAEAGAAKDDRIQNEILKIGVRQTGTVFTPYIKYQYANFPFDDLTWENVINIATAYYNDEITLQDITDFWSVGDSKEIDFSAMAASDNLSDTHVAQTANMVLVDINKTPLATPINGHANALLTFHMENPFEEVGKMNNIAAYVTQPIWGNIPRKSWCGGTCYNAIPSDVRSAIKTITHEGVSSTVFIPTVTQITDSTNAYEYYKTAANRAKNADYWTCSGVGTGSTTSNGYYVTASGASTGSLELYNTKAIAVAFCI